MRLSEHQRVSRSLTVKAVTKRRNTLNAHRHCTAQSHLCTERYEVGPSGQTDRGWLNFFNAVIYTKKNNLQQKGECMSSSCEQITVEILVQQLSKGCCTAIASLVMAC